jgi:iron complex transport system substrate-binding protein
MNTMKRFSDTTLLVCWFVCMAGCSKGCAPPAAPAAAFRGERFATNASDHREAPGYFAIDSLGRQVVIAREPRRIVSLSPACTELLFAVGVGDRVVGVTSLCDYPLQARELDKVGGFTSESLSIEKIVSLRPDLVISAGKIHEAVIARLEQLGVCAAALEAESFDELYRAIETLGRLTGREQPAAELVRSIERRVANVERIAVQIPSHRRLTVFYQVWDEPLLAAGPESFVGRLIELSGGLNVVSDVSMPYPEISVEVLVERDPQVILMPSHHGAEAMLRELTTKAGWSQVRAVRDRRAHLIDGDCVSRFGPRIVDALEEIAAAIYPGDFSDAALARDGALPMTDLPITAGWAPK